MSSPERPLAGAGTLPSPDVLAQALRRIRRPDYAAWAAGLAGAGRCAHPVRLHGTVRATDTATGETRLALDSAQLPDGVLLKSCGSRRATRCAACAAVYRSDARALILAGLRGGKGIGPEVSTRPLVFATLTAPSFGNVHVGHDDIRRPCQGRRGCCRHGRPRTCPVVHQPGDPALGQPICPDCYDTAGTVIWNACATELWRRTIIATRRAAAVHAGIRVRDADRRWTVAFVKIAEYQARGAVHFHALLRLDLDNPGIAVGSDTLVTALREAVARSAASNPLRPGHPIRWGTQVDTTPVPVDERIQLAGYLAKYATKSVDVGGALDHRLHHGDLTAYPLPDHLRRLAETAWKLGGDPTLGPLHLRHWAHTLGYRGHWLTKSRTWSTTLGQLRQDRYDWQARRRDHHHDADEVRTGEWAYDGTGHQNRGDQWLAHNAHLSYQTNRRTAWEER